MQRVTGDDTASTYAVPFLAVCGIRLVVLPAAHPVRPSGESATRVRGVSPTTAIWCSSLIRRQCGQPPIFDWAANGEVIEALKGIGSNAEEIVNDVVEVAADSGRTDAGGLRFQVKHLAKHPGLPEQSPIPARAPATDRVAKLGEHAEAESAVGGDLLVAAGYPGDILEVCFGQAPEPQVLGAIWRPFPQERVSQVPAGFVHGLPIPFEQVQTRRQPANPVDENAEVEKRFPRQHIPRRHSRGVATDCPTCGRRSQRRSTSSRPRARQLRRWRISVAAATWLDGDQWRQRQRVQ